MPKKKTAAPSKEPLYDQTLESKFHFICPDCKTVHKMTTYAIAQVAQEKPVTMDCSCGTKISLSRFGLDPATEKEEEERPPHTQLSEYLRMGWGKAVVKPRPEDQKPTNPGEKDDFEIKVNAPPQFKGKK